MGLETTYALQRLLKLFHRMAKLCESLFEIVAENRYSQEILSRAPVVCAGCLQAKLVRVCRPGCASLGKALLRPRTETDPLPT